MIDRYSQAYNLLQYIKPLEYLYLGEGKSSVVFREGNWVYKVFLLGNVEALSYKKYLLGNLKEKLDLFKGLEYFYEIKEIIEIDNKTFVLVYPFEESEPCLHFDFEEIENLLVECWERKLVFLDIKPDNAVRVNGKLKWIDYEPDEFTDNLFLNMAVRAFIFCRYQHGEKSFLHKVCRSAINQFDLPELEGVQGFLNRVFTKVIYKESSSLALHRNGIQKKIILNRDKLESKSASSTSFQIKYRDDLNIDKLFFDYLLQGYYLQLEGFDKPRVDMRNYFSPTKIQVKLNKLITPPQRVSLIIKACVQDSPVLFEAVKHIVRQLSFPNEFDEKILALDIRKENFLREYHSGSTWEDLIEVAELLVKEGIINRYIFPQKSDITAINNKWFNLDSSSSHTVAKVPVGAQLFAFDEVRNDYILQLDCDVMIGRQDMNHSFLNDMIHEIENNRQVLSVGFNIYKGREQNFNPYFGFSDSSFVPEVRFCLLKRSRIEGVLPLPNKETENGLTLSWYRSLEKRQRETNTYSLRGGDSRSFFIHPLNFKKKDKDTWFTMVDRVEQMIIPDSQIDEFDLKAAYYNWTISKRNEKLVIVTCFRSISFSRFLRFWYSLISQNYADWGLILIDDASENGLPLYIKHLIEPYKDKVTFISNKFRMGVAHNTYKAIHYFMENQNSIVVIVDGDDALLGKGVLKKIYEKHTYWEADVVIGKMFRTDKLHAHYKYKPNFTNPRLYGGNVWQHIRSFKKYLFDSLTFNDLKIKNKNINREDILLSKRFSHKMVFPEYCWDYTYMIPIIEMAQNPMCMDYYNILHDRTTPNTPKIKAKKDSIIETILSKPSKSSMEILSGRKTFLPNLKKIEIDITYACNLKCLNCNRSSTQAPIKEGIPFVQIQDFVQESIELNKKWELINLLGGEPTIHKDFLQIVNEILFKYIVPYSPSTILQVTSNGYGELVNERLSALPEHPQLIIDYASFKDGRIVQYFSPFNDAPINNPTSDSKEYRKGCWVTSYCGIGLNQLGYYPCGVAGGIDRVFQLDIGIKKLKNVDASIRKLLDKFCQYCGNFSSYASNKGDFIPRHEKAALDKPVMSAIWKEKYKEYNAKK